MKTIKFVPQEARGENKKFEGHVELRLPLLEERLEYTAGFGIEYDEDGTVKAASHDRMGTIVKMLKVARNHYVAVKIKNLANGMEHSDYESLSVDPDCSNILIEVAGLLMNGFKLGND